jgi:anaerobic sulfite reductase subunit C
MHWKIFTKEVTMDNQNIDLDALKKRGFLKSNQVGLFTLRTRMPAGNFQAEHLSVLNQVAKQYARGFVHLTTRQGIEIPFVKFEDIDEVESVINKAGIYPGTSGPRLRTTTACPGNNWCKRGLVDTFKLYGRIENELGIKCALDLPHKFKIVISGCPNKCTRGEASEIGIQGAVEVIGKEKRIGYAVYLGGCGGITPRMGFKLDKIYSEDEVLTVVEKVVTFFKNNAKPRQRLALLIEAIGRDNFLKVLNLP